MNDIAHVQELLSRWWFAYDEGRLDEVGDLLTDDVLFTVRTDTGKTDYEEFVNADYRGRAEVMAWQTEHRLDSPYPLRHCGLNVHLTETRGNESDFASYIFVTHIVEGQIAPLATAIVTGTARDPGGSLQLAALHVVLDTQSSIPLREMQASGARP